MIYHKGTLPFLIILNGINHRNVTLYPMYGKEEAKELKTLFWTSFGKYMRKHTTEYGSKIQWVNYKTGIKDIYFRLDADKRTAKVCVDLQHRDPEIREIFYDQFLETKTVFHELTGSEWIWLPIYIDDYGKEISRIYLEIDQVNMYNKDTWETMFLFFEKYMLGLDNYWEEFKDLFKQLD